MRRSVHLSHSKKLFDFPDHFIIPSLFGVVKPLSIVVEGNLPLINKGKIALMNPEDRFGVASGLTPKWKFRRIEFFAETT